MEMNGFRRIQREPVFWLPCVLAIGLLFIAVSNAPASASSGEKVYSDLLAIAKGKGDASLFSRLNQDSRNLAWQQAEETSFTGHLRILKKEQAEAGKEMPKIYLLRKMTGEVYILSIPADPALLAATADSHYAGLDDLFQNKMVFKIQTLEHSVNGETYAFARLTARPQQLALDKIFKISIILMLFFVMVGMGLTLTVKDFALVFTKPKGIILGEVLQFGFMPALAFAVGHLLGFYEEYPFIFVGMILITAIPGGVTSNLMTYYAKGDLALSISMTSFSTVLSILFTPLLLALYCANLPEVAIPVKVVVQTILILVIIPLFVGMTLRGKWPEFAKKATPFFSALGIIALLALIIAGVVGNLHVFSDTARYGFKFYLTVFALTLMGMLGGIVFSKLIGINNYQTRAISLETGLRNAALAMTIAMLIQDSMGDFYSSMFVTSGVFGLVMYIAGLISIALYKPLLPVTGEEEETGAQLEEQAA